MKLNYKLLKKLNACESGINKFVNTFGELEIPKGTKTITSTKYNFDIKWIADKLKIPNLIVKNGDRETYAYNDQGLQTRYEDSTGYWKTYEYNDQGLKTRYEKSNGYWETYTYNEKGLKTRSENSDGIPKYDFKILLT